MIALLDNNNNPWYQSHSFQFQGHEWKLSYLAGNAKRVLSCEHLTVDVPIADIAKYRSPQLFLQKWIKGKGKRQYQDFIRGKESAVIESKLENLFDLINADADAEPKPKPKSLLEVLEPLELDVIDQCVDHSWKYSDRLNKYICEFCGEEKCLDTATSFQESAALPTLGINLGELQQPSSLKSIQTLNLSCERITPTSQSTTTSDPITQNQENLTLSPAVFPALEHPTQENEKDWNIQTQHYGEKELDVLSSVDPNSSLLSSLMESSIEDLEQYLEPLEWSDINLRLKLSQRRGLGLDTLEPDCSLFPTLTSCSSKNSRPAGATKCEQWFKRRGLIPNGSQLSAQAIAKIMGFPEDYLNPLCPSLTIHQDESAHVTLQDEPLHQDKQRSPSPESSISIPCPNEIHDKYGTWVKVSEKAVKGITPGDNNSENSETYIIPVWHNEALEVVDSTDVFGREHTNKKFVVLERYDDQHCLVVEEGKRPRRSTSECGDVDLHGFAVGCQDTFGILLGETPISINVGDLVEFGIGVAEVINIAAPKAEILISGGQSFWSPIADLKPTLKIEDKYGTWEKVGDERGIPVWLNRKLETIILSEQEYSILERLEQKLLILQKGLRPKRSDDEGWQEGCGKEWEWELQITSISPATFKSRPNKSSGSLYPFVQNKKNKDGTVKSYPLVEGDRDRKNPNHWCWVYCWDEKIDGKWKTIKRSCPREKLGDVEGAIAAKKPVAEILKLLGEKRK